MPSTSPNARMHLPFLLITFYLTLSTSDCMAVSCNLTPHHELAMSEGMEITVDVGWTTIKIKAGKGCKRSYTWDGRTAKVKLWADEQRWVGGYGIIHAAVRPPHKDVFHMIVREAQQNFQTVEEAEKWLKSIVRNNHSARIYSDDGLVVDVDKRPGPRNRAALDIHVWQIYIGGTQLSPVQEDGSKFYAALEKIFEQAKENGVEFDSEMGIESLKESNEIYTRIYFTGGNKPTTLRGSQNSKISVSTPVGK